MSVSCHVTFNGVYTEIAGLNSYRERKTSSLPYIDWFSWNTNQCNEDFLTLIRVQVYHLSFAFPEVYL